MINLLKIVYTFEYSISVLNIAARTWNSSLLGIRVFKGLDKKYKLFIDILFVTVLNTNKKKKL